MELTRRDAAAALAALGAGGAVVSGVRRGGRGAVGESPGAGNAALDDREVADALIAVAEVVYPSTVSGTETFVRSFLEGRFDREDHADALRETVAELDDLAAEWHGAGIAALRPDVRDRLLREVGADTAGEDPDGTFAERVRYYVVNELLLALYASPTGGELVGIENPQGHPGGRDSYQRGPTS